MAENYQFNPLPETIPKRYPVILPQWKEVLTELSVAELNGDISEINAASVAEMSEEELSEFLHSMLKEMSKIDSEEDKRAYILRHQQLRAALNRVFADEDDAR